MGNNTSSPTPQEEGTNIKGKKVEKRKYKVPEVRERERFEQLNVTTTVNLFEATIDKYDYLIVFPKTEGSFVKFNEPRKNNESYVPFVKWDVIRELWKQAVPGTDAVKDSAVESLARYWKKRTGSEPKDGQEIRVISWLTIAREAIIDQLSTKSGLQLKLTANAKYIFCRIRAPIKLLERQAAQISYHLQLKGEIDPGSEQFWNVILRGRPVELDEERKLYSKDKANEILQNLYRAGKISATDIGVDDQKESQAAWSRRVHALERIADQVPIYNTYVAHVPFSLEKHLRYLYQTYPSVRGKTIFRAKDRLYLTKSIIDKYFDCEVLADKSRAVTPVIEDIMALHDANRGEVLNVDLLQRRWVTFWLPTAKDAGTPYVSHPAYEGENEVPWYLRPFAQPLSEIRDYFGERIGLYFAWFGFYILALTFPALLGIALEIVYLVRGYVDTDTVDTPSFVILGLIIVWGAVYHAGWSIEEKIISLKWGTHAMVDQDSTERPQFRPDPEQPTIRSAINNRLITYFPASKRAARTFGTTLLTILAIIADLAFIALFFYIDIAVLSNSSFSDITWISSFMIAIVIKIASISFRPLARIYTDYENHRSQSAYDNSLVVKVVLFELFNSYAALIYTAFIKEHVFDGCTDVCIVDLRQLLISIIIVRVTIHIVDLFLPQIKRAYNEYYAVASTSTTTTTVENDQLLQNDDLDENNEYMLEIDRTKYDGTFDDFAYAVIQYGYLMLFASALSILAVVALFENLIKLRTDGLKLCRYVRRPHVQLASGLGTWSSLMEAMSYLGVLTSVGILIFTADDFVSYSTYEKLIIFLITEQVVILLKLIIRHVLITAPAFVYEIEARQRYIEDKYYKGYEDEPIVVETANTKGVLEDYVDVDGMNLYDLRKGVTVSEEEYKAMEKLEEHRRKVNRDLRTAKDKLLEVYKSETYNEATGVGETKHGLPLGRLSVKVLEVQGLPLDDAIIENQYVKVRVNIKSTRKGVTNAGPPLGPLNDTSQFMVTRAVVGVPEGKVSVNQALGPFAPIRTQDADVVFDLLDMTPKANEASLATCSIRLRELQDQQSRDQVLPLLIRNNKKQLQTEPKLLVNLKFEYSKVVPLRNKIYQLQEKLRKVEKKLAMMRSGRKVDNDDDDDLDV